MAGINLVPNPGVLGTLLAVFAVNYFIIKKLIVDTFLKLKEKRESMTSGSEDQAKSLLEENQRIESQIESKTRDALEEARMASQKIIQDATDRQNEIIKSAQSASQETLKGIRIRIQNELINERSKIPVVSEKVAGQIYSTLVGS